MALNTFWKNKKVFITGHTGFKGTWLTCYFKNLGAEVIGYSLPLERYRSFKPFSATQFADKNYLNDIRNVDELRSAITSSNPDIIIHMAAQSIVSRGYEDPSMTWDVNLKGTQNLIDALISSEHKNCPVLFVTTDKVYSNDDTGKIYIESDPLGGDDPYSASKAASEILIKSYQQTFEGALGNWFVARAGNVIGGGDDCEDRLFPDILRAVKQKKPLIIRSPYAIRPWQHVLETTAAYINLSYHLLQDTRHEFSAFNIGPSLDSTPLNVSEIVARVKSRFNIEVEIDQRSKISEKIQLRLDPSKIMAKFHWMPAYSVEDAIELTFDFWEAQLDGDEQALDKFLFQIINHREKYEN